WRLGAEVWGYGGSRLGAGGFSGANPVPGGSSYPALRAFAERGRRQGRGCSSIVGPGGGGLAPWGPVRACLGRPRGVRRRPPLPAITADPLLPADPAVRRVRVTELDTLVPACIAMFTEEVGVSPIGLDGGAAYRRRVRDLVEEGRAFARIEGGEVLFK